MRYAFTRSFISMAIALFLTSCHGPTEGSWQASMLHRIDSKIQSVDFGLLWEDEMPRLALVAADGRCIVLWREEGGWKQCQVYCTPGGLSSVAIGEADPDGPGPDLIVGGSTGHVLAISLLKTGDVLSRLIYDAGVPIGDIEVFDLNPDFPGEEIIVVTEDGKAVVLWQSSEGPHPSYEAQVVWTDPARLRNAVAGPYGPQGRPCALVAGAAGNVVKIYSVGGTWRGQVLYKSPESLSRLAVGDVDPESPGLELVVVDDTGGITLLRQGMGGYVPQAVHKEEKALRGVVVADFDPSTPGKEIAVYGYGMEVAIFCKGNDGFERKVLFKDTDRGHWLLAGQMIPESKPFELVAVGYSGKITLISFEGGPID